MREELKGCEAEVAERNVRCKREGLPRGGLWKTQQALSWHFLLGANCKDFPRLLGSDASWYHWPQAQ